MINLNRKAMHNDVGNVSMKNGLLFFYPEITVADL